MTAIKDQIQALRDSFARAFGGLGVSISPEYVQALAETVHQAMTANTRYYHNLNHIFPLVATDEPVTILAALYHDIVYYQVDQGLTPEIERLVRPYVQIRQGGTVRIEARIRDSDELASMAIEIFDLRPGQELPAPGTLNEFLSALVMLKQLGGHVPTRELIQITLMIEATIPFRGRDTRGRTHFEVLAERLRRTSSRWCNPPLGEAEVELAIKSAVLFSNKDIESFAEPDTSRFLDNTWKLLPETNPFHLVPNIYTIRSYRQALQQMQRFLCRLKPDDVFSQYHGTPPEAEFNRIVGHAHVNLRLGCEYLKIRLVAISLLEALAEVSGGDASMRLFLADLPSKDGQTRRFDHYLPRMEAPSWVDTSSTIYGLLSHSRDSDWGYDRVSSPLSRYVYMSLPPEERMAAFEVASQMFAGELTADEFLQRMDQGIVGAVARASAEIVLTRRELLLKYARLSGTPQ
jgi:hypothetical protein